MKFKKFLSICTTVAMALSITLDGGGLISLNTKVSAAGTITVGAFSISPTNIGDTLINGTDYSYKNNVLTILSTKPITIANTNPDVATTTDSIVVKKDVSADITLAGVNIDVSAAEYKAAFKIEDDSNGDVTITLEESTQNTLKSGARMAGLQKNGNIGTLTISGTGTVTATSSSDGNSYYGAGIGGGSEGTGSNITISGGTITTTGYWGAGIGGGWKGSGSNITINGGTVITSSGSGGAGIGGGNEGTSSNIIISGGTVTATSKYGGAGIGGGTKSTGSDIIISGGTVTATGATGIGGGSEGTGSNITISGGTVITTGYSGAGIGGGTRANGSNITISGGTITATSNLGVGIGHGYGGTGEFTLITNKKNGTPGDAWIEASSITDCNTSNWSGVIFQGYEGQGQVYGNQILTANREIPTEKTLLVNKNSTLTVNSTLTNNNGTLKVNGGIITGSGTIIGDGQFFTTNLSADMITVPTSLVYNGNDRSSDINDITYTADKNYCGKEFHITGWTKSVSKVSDLQYNVTYIPDEGIDGTEIIVPVTLAQSGTELISTLKDNKTAYKQGEVITINATVSPTGLAPSTLADFTEPTQGQVAVFDGETQVSEPVTPNESGECTLTVNTNDLSVGHHTLTVMYNATDVMAQAVHNIDISVNQEGVIEANSSVYTFKNTLTTNKDNVTVPNTQFDFTITPATTEDLADDIKVGIGAPTITSTNFTTTDVFTDKSVSKDTTVDFTDIVFPSAGIYRYVLQEALPAETTSGIVMDANDRRYLDVYVENTEDSSLKIAYWVLSIPGGDKTDEFKNQYNVFNFSVSNTVTGSAGDKEKDFTQTIVFDATTIKNANISATKNGTNEDITLADDNKTYTVLLKHGETVDFNNVPKGAKYTIVESNNVGYITTISKAGLDTDSSIDDSTFTFADSTDGITDDTQIIYTNNKDSILPTGIGLTLAIPTIVGVIIISVAILLIICKRKDYSDVD